jgi:hypothetical protein
MAEPAADRNRMIAQCACTHGEDIRMIDAEGPIHMDGSVAAAMTPAEHGGLDLTILGYTATGEHPEWGRVTLDCDFSQRVEASSLVPNPGVEGLPATQTMRIPMSMTSDRLPGEVLHSRAPAVLANESVTNWPPDPGSAYRLAEPVEFRDSDGAVRAVIQRSDTQIVGSEFDPDEVVVSSQLRVRPAGPRRGVTEGAGERGGEAEFTFARGGDVTVDVFGADDTPMGTVFSGRVEAGTQRISLGDAEAADYFRVSLDGEPVSGPMPLRMAQT